MTSVLRLAPLLFAGLLAFSACAARPPLTPFSAGELAARLANEECQERYGLRPFAPDDFEAVFRLGRWQWGGEEDGQPVDGFHARVTFGPEGRRPTIEVSRNDLE